MARVMRQPPGRWTSSIPGRRHGGGIRIRRPAARWPAVPPLRPGGDRRRGRRAGRSSVRRGRGRRTCPFAGEPVRRVGDGAQPEHARPALGGAGTGHVVHDPGGGRHPARARGEERDDPAPNDRPPSRMPAGSRGRFQASSVDAHGRSSHRAGRPGRNPVPCRPSSASSPTVVPSSISRTPGWETPLTVTRPVPRVVGSARGAVPVVAARAMSAA